MRGHLRHWVACMYRVLLFGFALSVLLASAAPPAAASTVLADFEDGTPLVPGMAISNAAAATGPCAKLTGTSHALCGADTDGVAPGTGSTLAFAGLDFGRLGALRFDLAADARGGEFDPLGSAFADFVRIRAVIGGADTLLAEFARAGSPAHFLASTGAGALLDAGLRVDDTFSTIVLSGVSGLLHGTGDLVFQFRLTDPDDVVGIDNIVMAPVSLPAGLPLLVIALGALLCVRRVARKAPHRPP